MPGEWCLVPPLCHLVPEEDTGTLCRHKDARDDVRCALLCRSAENPILPCAARCAAILLVASLFGTIQYILTKGSLSVEY